MQTIKVRFGSNEFALDYTDQTTTADFVRRAACLCGRSENRVRLQVVESQQRGRKRYLDPRNESLAKQLSKFDAQALEMKYIGVQVGYQAVFLIEYIGPLAIWLWLNRRSMNTMASAMWLGHFLKRVLETLFVHRFSNATMPIKNLLKNCTYYWGFAVLNGRFSNIADDRTPIRLVAICLFCLAELMNFYTHMILRGLRSKDSTEYVNPSHFLFRHIACPNYGFEVLAWVSFTLYARTLSACAFTICGLVQILDWAKDKKARLAKEFGAAGERRWLIMYGL